MLNLLDMQANGDYVVRSVLGNEPYSTRPVVKKGVGKVPGDVYTRFSRTCTSDLRITSLQHNHGCLTLPSFSVILSDLFAGSCLKNDVLYIYLQDRTN